MKKRMISQPTLPEVEEKKPISGVKQCPKEKKPTKEPMIEGSLICRKYAWAAGNLAMLYQDPWC